MESLLCTIAECAALLHISADTVEREIRRGIIPAKKIRSTVRISREWINSYVAESAPMLLTRRQVSRKLGISVTSVTTLQRKGALPVVMVIGRPMVPAAAVAEYVKRNSFAFLRSGTRKRNAPVQERCTVPAVSVPVGRSRFSNIRGV